MKTVFHSLWSTVVAGERRKRSLLQILRQIPIFEGLNPLELRFVVRILHERKYEANELVFREGEAGNGMYIIQSGSVRITGQGSLGEVVQYAHLYERQFFGELSLVDGEPRSATAIIDGAAVLYGFFKPDLLELIAKNPQLGSKILFNLTSVLATRLRDTNTKLIDLQGRLADQGVKGA